MKGYYNYIKELYLKDFIIASIVTNLYGGEIRYNHEADTGEITKEAG